MRQLCRRRFLALGLVATLAIAAPAAATSPAPAASAAPEVEIRIAVSTPVLADIVARAAGPRAEVWSIVPSTGDPHSYSATPRDLERAATADLYVEMGANLERYAESGAWRRMIAESGIPVVRLADHVDLIVRDLVIDHGDHVHDLRDGDPHAWFDPQRVRQMVAAVRDALIEVDPAGADAWTAAADAWDAELVALDAEIDATLAAIPSDRRRLVVLHDAYAYLAERYGFEVLGFVSRSPEQEPSAADVAALLELVRSSGVPAVFSEPQLADDILRMVAAEAGVEVGVLLTDSFTADVDSYPELMRHDAAELVRLLG
jgi:ABC-type Zn uptake system ZnuABC Zn-binding protein ZnuA